MAPPPINTSVRDMTQRLLEQFRGDVRARAQRPPPEQKKKELGPPLPPPPPEEEPRRGVSPAATTLMGVPVPSSLEPPPGGPPSLPGGAPQALPPLPLAMPAAMRPPATLAQQPVGPSLPSVGDELTLDRGGKVTVDSQQGSSDGAPAFRVKTAERELAMLWLTPAPARPGEGPRERLKKAAQMGSPSAHFLWPVDGAGSSKVAGFGCLLPVGEPRFEPLGVMLAGAPPPLRSRVTAALDLAEALLALHSAGWSFRSLMFRDILIDPARGEARVAGCERALGVIEARGSGELTAPEARSGQPFEGSLADLHSLAVLQFCLLYQQHPFVGRKALAAQSLDVAAIEQLCASPAFIFEAGRRDNDAVPLAQDPSGRAGGRAIPLWETTLPEVKTLFTQAFTDGLRNPSARPGASSWRIALGKLRDALFPCAGCSTDNVYDLAALQARGGKPGSCIHCGRELVLPARIRVGRSVIVLPQGGRLYRHHVESGRPVGSEVVAEVSAHPLKPEILGMKNVTGQPWSVQWPDGKLLPLEPGKTIKLESGLKIQFGKQEGEVRR